MPQTKIRVIIFPEADKWVAQCLEHDICVQADSVEELEPRIQMAVMMDFEESLKVHHEAFKGIPPAPAYYQTMWERKATGLRGEFVIESSSDGSVKAETALAA